MSIGERVELLIEKEGSQAEFIRKTDINRGTIDKLLNRGGGISTPNVEKILLAYPSLNARWLITGEGKMWGSETVGDLQEELEACREELAQVKDQLQDEEELNQNLNKLSSFLRADIDRMKKEQGLE